MTTTIDLTHHHAINHYVATGQRRHPDPTIVIVDHSTGDPRSVPTEPGSLTRPVLVRRRSTGQQTPSPTTSLPANSRTEATVPRDISTWRQAVPLGCQPPEDSPWTSPLGDESSASERGVEGQVITHAERKPDLDISTALASTPPVSIPQTSQKMDVHQWRYENYVDWWRTGIAAQNGNVDPPPQNMPVDNDESSSEPRRITVLGKHPEEKPRTPPVLSIPPPPPPPQVIRVVEIPTLQVSSSPTKGNGHSNLKRVYYKLITRSGDPVPVREISRTNSMVADSSVGVLFVENPSSTRAKDLMTRILSREYAHSSSDSSNFSPRLREKFAEQNVTGASLASPTHDAFVIQQQSPPAGAAKVALYCHGTNGKRKGRKLKDGDLLPRGVGIDEQTALVVEVQKESATTKRPPRRKGSNPVVGASRKGVASILRGLALGLKSVGDGLAKFADCLSGTGVKSRANSLKFH